MKQKKTMVNLMLAIGVALAPMGRGLEKAQASEHEAIAIPAAIVLAPIAVDLMMGVVLGSGLSTYAYYKGKIALPKFMVGDGSADIDLPHGTENRGVAAENGQVEQMLQNGLLRTYNGLKTQLEFAQEVAGAVSPDVWEAFVNTYKETCGILSDASQGYCSVGSDLQSKLAELNLDTSFLQSKGIVLMSDKEVQVYRKVLREETYGQVLRWSNETDGHQACLKGKIAALRNCSNIYMANPQAFLPSSGMSAFHNCATAAVEFDIACDAGVVDPARARLRQLGLAISRPEACESGRLACVARVSSIGLGTTEHLKTICGSAKNACVAAMGR